MISIIHDYLFPHCKMYLDALRFSIFRLTLSIPLTHWLYVSHTSTWWWMESVHVLSYFVSVVSLKYTHAESGQMSYRVEIRLIWRRSSLLRIKWNQSLSTYHLQSILGKSFILITQLQSVIFSIGFVLFVPHYRLPLNSVHSTSIERQEGRWEKNGHGLTIWGRWVEVQGRLKRAPSRNGQEGKIIGV